VNERNRYTRFVTSTVAASLAVLALLTAVSFLVVSRLHGDSSALKETQFALYDSAWEVKYLDEALTHSATQYALTKGSIPWRSRYDALVKRLDEVLANLQAQTDAKTTAPFDAVSEANYKLVQLEADVFAAVDRGEPEKAASILAGPYNKQKQIYQKGVDEFFNSQRTLIDMRLSRAVGLSSWLRFASILPGLTLGIAVLMIGRSSLRTARLATDRDHERGRAIALRETEQRITSALDLAQTESEVLGAVHDILVAEFDGHVELLLADSSRTHLRQAISTDPTRQLPGCGVPSPSQCPAIRRGSAMTFDDPSSYASCPHLRSRAVGDCKAMCVPVSLMGQTVGVIHGLSERSVDYEKSKDNGRLLERIANQVGDRVGVMRTLDKSQLQAATDPLTGLLNRRSLEQRVTDLGTENTPYSVVLFDLDHFKKLNDTHGHATGDIAIRVFAKTLRDALRTNDLICRWGGEEFLVVLPHADLAVAELLTERIREVLVLTLTSGTTPFFTTSAGVAEAHINDALLDVVARADEALLLSKQNGRDRITLASAGFV
jgi:diguanylate cyclase (GGDEF)-like protein